MGAKVPSGMTWFFGQAPLLFSFSPLLPLNCMSVRDCLITCVTISPM